MYDDYSGGKLIKVYLPQYIIDVFERDIENFEIKLNGKANLSRFCNLIFEYMKDRYMSEPLKLKNSFSENWLKTEFRNILRSDFQLSGESSNQIAKVVENKLNETLEEIYKPEKMKFSDYITFRLDNENGIYFSLIERNFGRNITASDFFRAIFLSYSVRPQFEREKIICYPIYEKILKAVKSKNIILMKLKMKNEAYEQTPCFVKENKEEMFNYVVVLDRNKKIKTPRLSSFEDVKILENRKYNFRDDELEMIDKFKRNFDPLSINVSEVKIRLSRSGKYMFKRMIHNRPDLERIENEDIYVFNCSYEKIRAYFFKYSTDAKIISPKEFAEAFKNEYKSAYEKYAENEKTE